VSTENQLSDYLKMFVPSRPETGTSLHQTVCQYRMQHQLDLLLYLRYIIIPKYEKRKLFISGCKHWVRVGFEF
jgi:hypothetical protein